MTFIFGWIKKAAEKLFYFYIKNEYINKNIIMIYVNSHKEEKNIYKKKKK